MNTTAIDPCQGPVRRPSSGNRAGQLRILHVLPHLSGGGAERQMSYLVPELVRMGHEVHVAYLAASDRESALSLPGAHLHRLRACGNYDLRILWQLIRLLRRIRPNVVHTWIMQMDILGGVAARITKVPWMLREASSRLAYPPNWKHRLRTWVAANAVTIVANSAGGKAYWHDQYPNTHCCVIPNGLPLDELASAEPYSRKELGIAPGEPMVLYVGRLASEESTQKNLRALLAALVEVIAKIPAVAVLCGGGPQRRELEEEARAMGIGDRVRFLGHRPPSEVWRLLKCADVFVSLSAFEGCPNAVIEAMACGCSLVASDIPAHREILDQKSAFFADPNDSRQTAETILASLSDVDHARQRAKTAQASTAQWSIPSMAQQYEAAYTQASRKASC